MSAKHLPEPTSGAAHRRVPRLRALRLALYRHRRLASVPPHLRQDIIGDCRRR